MSGLLPTFDHFFKLLSVLGPIVTFLWGVYIWRDKSLKELDAARFDAERVRETRQVEATKPFLERQLTLYNSATKTAAIIAKSNDQSELHTAVECFWRLYWGELALVENREVEAAMVELGKLVPTFETAMVEVQKTGLKSEESQQLRKENEMIREKLQQLSLRLAHACRHSLDKSWGIKAWSDPDRAARDASAH